LAEILQGARHIGKTVMRIMQLSKNRTGPHEPWKIGPTLARRYSS